MRKEMQLREELLMKEEKEKSGIEEHKEEETENSEIEEYKEETENSEIEEYKEEEIENSEIEIQIFDLNEPEKEEIQPVKKSGWKKVGIVIGALLLAYCGIAMYFTQAFYYGTEINGESYAFATVNSFYKEQEKLVDSYTLTFETIDGNQEVITADEIELAYIENAEVAELIKQQNAFLWPEMFLNSTSSSFEIEVEYSEEACSIIVSQLELMDEEHMTEPINAYIEFQEDTFCIVAHEWGTSIEESALFTAIDAYVLEMKSELNLAEEGCYKEPEYMEDSEELIAEAETFNLAIQGTITYAEGEVIDKETLVSWMEISDENEISFSEEKIEAFVTTLADKYNTVGSNRTFISAIGETVEVSGGSYGWIVDEYAEVEQILADIEGGVSVEREIEYSRRGESHEANDWGDTYTEIDLTNQKVYYILDGEVVVEGDIVTGDVSDGNATPEGVYCLTYKTTNAILHGTQYADGTYSYEAAVSYWMPFNGGIGMHDASWRSSLGGDIYLTNGSHGCINMDYETAQAIYGYLSTGGDPIICHY